MRRLLTQVGSKIGSRQDVTHGWLYDFTMTVETIPNFTEPAAKLWKAIPADIKELLLANVWCGQCRDATIITNFTGVVRKGDLLLVGKCARCHGDVARLIESS